MFSPLFTFLIGLFVSISLEEMLWQTGTAFYLSISPRHIATYTIQQSIARIHDISLEDG